MTTLTNSRHADSRTGFPRVLARLRAKLRRAIALAGAPYMNGPMPPL